MSGIAAYEVWASYGRVSKEEEKLGYSIASQGRENKEHVVGLGAGNVEEFMDDGVPGDILNRPALSALRQRIRKGGIVGVVCYDPDRLARDLATQLLLADEIEGAGVRLEFVNHEYKHTDEGRLFFQIRGAIAEFERRKIRERTTRGKREKALSGLIPGLPSCYGYVYEEGELTPDPDQAVWVLQMYRWRALDHLGYSTIARRLQDLGVKSPRGTPWNRSSVRYIVTNPTYKGEFSIRYDTSGVHKNKYMEPGQKVRKRLLAPEEWLRIAVPALIPADLWDAAQAVNDGSIRSTPERWHQYLLSGIMRCARCGARMRGKMLYHDLADGSRKARPYYVCSRKDTDEPWKGGERCSLRSVKADTVEALVWETVSSWLDDPRAYAQAVAEQQPDEAAAWQRELQQVTHELDGVGQERQRVIRMAAKGHISEAEEDNMMTEINERVVRLQARRGTLERVLIRQNHDPAQKAKDVRQRLKQATDAASIDVRRQVLRELLDHVTVGDGEIRIIPKA